MAKTARQQHLEEDLATLADLLTTAGPLPPRHVRSVGAAIVRKWLLDGNLNHLAKELSVTFELPTYDTESVFETISHRPEITVFIAGGIVLGGVPVRSIYVSKEPFSGTPPIPGETKITFLKPSKFLKSKRIYFQGTTFSTEQIILFTANKYGGVHFDPNREIPWHKQLEDVASYITFGNPNNEDKTRVVELGEPGGPCMIVIPLEKGHLWTCLDIELLSAAQSLLNLYCNGHRLIITADDQT